MPTLYVVGTPIGNLEDITLRALRVLQDVSLVAAEDTRKARVLFNHFQIGTPLTSYYEANERQKLSQVLDALGQGDVALISEAGMPGISDPGYPLIRAALEAGFPVVPVPGPSAHTAALVASGLPTDAFYFAGFLPRKHRDRQAVLLKLKDISATLIFYEAPHRLIATLEEILSIWGDREIALCREMTKLYEEVWRGTVSDALLHTTEIAPRGEYTLVVAGLQETETIWLESDVRRALTEVMESGLSRSQAARDVAGRSGWSRRDVYALDDTAHSA